MKSSARKLKYTPWYSGVNPLKSRPGWYSCDCGCKKSFLWDGAQWYDQNILGVYELIEDLETWRGIA